MYVIHVCMYTLLARKKNANYTIVVYIKRQLFSINFFQIAAIVLIFICVQIFIKRKPCKIKQVILFFSDYQLFYSIVVVDPID